MTINQPQETAMTIEMPKDKQEELEWCEDALTMGIELDEVSGPFQAMYAKYLKEKGQLQ